MSSIPVWVTSRYFNFPYRFGKFLCLTADIFHPKEDIKDIRSRRVKFMVDSGSDIVTLNDDIIEELHLPKIGWCEQEGADGIKRKKPFYSACLGIGEKKIDVKVRFALTYWFAEMLVKHKFIHSKNISIFGRFKSVRVDQISRPWRNLINDVNSTALMPETRTTPEKPWRRGFVV